MKKRNSTILAIGAEGRLAGLVVPAAAKHGARVRAFVRHADNAAAMRENGASEIALGDLRDSASMEAAVRGVDAVFHVGPAFIPDEAELGLRLIQAARSAGVRKIVFSGVNHPTNLQLPNHIAKQPVESALFASGMIYIILHPMTLMQNFAPEWPSIVRGGVFAEPYSVDARLARVDYRDVAEVAAIALTEDHLDFGTFELAADGLPSRIDIAAEMAKVAGRAIVAKEQPFDDWVRLARPPYDAAQLELLKQVFAYFSAHGAAGNSLVLAAILGRRPRTLEQFVSDLAARLPTTA